MLLGSFSFVGKTKQGDVYKVNTTLSKVEFIGSKADGYHPGYFLLKGGEVNVSEGKISGGNFTINLSSLKVTDEAGATLETHLKAPDFLDLAKGTEANFSISNVKDLPENKYEIDGILNFKGITSPVKFVASVRNLDGKKLFAEATFQLDKTSIGVALKQAKIASDIQIIVHLFANK